MFPIQNNPFQNLSSFIKQLNTPRALEHADFQRMTRNLDNVDALLSKYRVDDPCIHDYLEGLKNGDWTSVIFSELDELPFRALFAYYEKLITVSQFTTTLFFWAVCQHHETTEIEIRSIDRDFELVKSTFWPTKNGLLTKTFSLQEPYLSDDRCEAFLAKLKTYPQSEQKFFILPDLSAEDSSPLTDSIVETMINQVNDGLAGKSSISQEIMTGPSINVFNRVEIEGRVFRMVPSFAMMQTFIDLFGSEDGALSIVPVIGASTLEEIAQNAFDDTRDMGLPFPGVDLPKTADSFTCSLSYDFFYHDFYHALIVSNIPSNHRKAFMESFSVFRQKADSEKDPELNAFYLEFAERVADLEIFTYRPSYTKLLKSQYGEAFHEDIRFWDGLNNIWSGTVSRMVNLATKKFYVAGLPAQAAASKGLIEVSLKVLEKNVVKKIAKELLTSVDWEAYGLSISAISLLSEKVQHAIERHPLMMINEEARSAAINGNMILQLNEVAITIFKTELT